MKTIRSECGRILRGAGTEGRSLPAVISIGEEARDGHKVAVSGWVYPASVPFVNAHRDDAGIRSVLGNVTYIRTGVTDLDSGDRVPALLGTVNYARGEINPEGEVAWQLALAGYCTALSASFFVIESELANERGRRPGALNISKAELCEVSAVVVPSDTAAKVIVRAVRNHIAGRATREDRRALAEAHQRRIERDDLAARVCETRDDRLKRALVLAGKDVFDCDELRRRLLADQS